MNEWMNEWKTTYALIDVVKKENNVYLPFYSRDRKHLFVKRSRLSSFWEHLSFEWLIHFWVEYNIIFFIFVYIYTGNNKNWVMGWIKCTVKIWTFKICVPVCKVQSIVFMYTFYIKCPLHSVQLLLLLLSSSLLQSPFPISKYKVWWCLWVIIISSLFWWSQLFNWLHRKW